MIISLISLIKVVDIIETWTKWAHKFDTLDKRQETFKDIKEKTYESSSKCQSKRRCFWLLLEV